MFGVCCENVIGYIPLPVGVAGPMLVDDETYQIPMATTEGCLVASTSRGCKAISLGGGAKTEVINDGMSRGPVVTFPSVRRAAAMKRWVDNEGGFEFLKASFESTSRYAKLCKVSRNGIYLRSKSLWLVKLLFYVLSLKLVMLWE